MASICTLRPAGRGHCRAHATLFSWGLPLESQKRHEVPDALFAQGKTLVEFNMDASIAISWVLQSYLLHLFLCLLFRPNMFLTLLLGLQVVA